MSDYLLWSVYNGSFQQRGRTSAVPARGGYATEGVGTAEVVRRFARPHPHGESCRRSRRGSGCRNVSLDIEEQFEQAKAAAQGLDASWRESYTPALQRIVTMA